MGQVIAEDHPGLRIEQGIDTLRWSNPQDTLQGSFDQGKTNRATLTTHQSDVVLTGQVTTIAAG